MRILVVCQHYWPEAFQVTEVAEAFAADGHEVAVLTGLPNYPSGIIPEEYKRGRNREQKRNGVTIVRAPLLPRRRGPLGLAVNYYSFSLSAKGIARRLPEGFDVVMAYQLSPVMMMAPAVEYAKMHAVPLLVYCCDLWPESMKVILGDRFGFLLEHYRKVSGRLYRAADAVAVQSPAFVDYLSQTHGIPRSKMRFVPQFATGSDSLVPVQPHDGVNFVITGNIGRAQDMPTILTAFSLMKHTDGVRLHVVGEGPCLEESKELAIALGISDRVVFYGRRPVEEMPAFYAMADAFVIALDGSSWVGTTIPARLQGYMSAGRPVLAAIDGGAADVIAESACGAAVPAGDSVALACLLDRFLADPLVFSECGLRGRCYFEERFDKARYMASLYAMMDEMIEENK